MKSLTLLTRSSINLPSGIDRDRTFSFGHDGIEGYWYLCKIGEDGDCLVYRTKDSDSHPEEYTSFPIESASPITIVDVQFLIESEALCLVLSNGEVFMVSGTDPDKVELVASLNQGIMASKWSLDEETVAVYTFTNELIMLNRNFDELGVTSVLEDVDVVESTYAVGWGKKETQFHGSLGKQAAKQVVNTSQYRPSPVDLGQCLLAWRGDDQFISVSIKQHGEDGLRCIKVYDREMRLQSVSETVDGLEPTLAWKPSGAVIASTQRAPNRYQVVFFERNGLRHGEFTLPTTVKRVHQLVYNCDSTLLAAHIEKDDGSYYVQVWYANNYFWYLKYELDLSTGDQIDTIKFHQSQPLTLTYATHHGQFHTIQFQSDHLASNILHEQSGNVTASINGSDLMLTALKYQNMPPPMAGATVNLSSQLIHVSYAQFANGNTLIALTKNQEIHVVSYPQMAKHNVPKPNILFSLNVSTENVVFHQVAYPQKGTVVLLGYDLTAQKDVVTQLRIEDSNEQIKVIDKFTKRIDDKLIRMISHPSDGSVLVLSINGAVFKVELEDHSIELDLVHVLKERCDWIQPVVDPVDPSLISIVALSSRTNLYLNTQLISNNATTFYVHRQFVVYTTNDHKLRFYPLKGDGDELKLDSYARNLERGAGIVCGEPYGIGVVLQMPRGNLETIYPRALCLTSILHHLDHHRYLEAFLLCRTHRIDMNILVDYRPTQFLANLAKFITQVNKVDYLNLFLSSLTGDNVLATKYPLLFDTTHPESEEVVSLEGDAKVNSICTSTYDVLTQLNDPAYLPTTITCLVKQIPPNLTHSLELILSIQPTNPSLAQSGLTYAIFLSNITDLYNTALGLYNFQLCLQVAEKSQMDPKEYLPFLNQLKSFECEKERRFKIDLYLGRVTKVLSGLKEMELPEGDDRFDEGLKFIVKEGCYVEAMKMFKGEGWQYKEIVNIYAKDLVFKKKFEEAGSAYQSVQLYQLAIDSYVKVGAWQMALTCANHLKLGQDELVPLVDELIVYLKANQRHVEASQLICRYKKDPEENVGCLLEGHHWTRAVYHCESDNRLDLIDTDVKPRIDEYCDQLNEDMDDMLDQFTKQTNRIRELHNTPKPLLPLDGDGLDLDNVDVMSDATSAFTNFTVYTKANTVTTQTSMGSKKTGKSRRRLERKKHSGKKGSVFEYQYLLASINRLAERINGLQDDIKQVQPAMVSLNLSYRTGELRAKLISLVQNFESGLEEAFKDPGSESYLEFVCQQLEAQTEQPEPTPTRPTIKPIESWMYQLI